MPLLEPGHPSDDQPPGIRLEVAHLAFAGVTLFRDFVLELPGGRWTCLLGPSGVGKSTLLRLLAGLLPGAVRSASDGLPLRGRIAWMAQSDLLFPWLSVLENAILGYRLRRAPRALLEEKRAQARVLLAELGLGDRLDAAPATLSGGMRQRVALARTLLEERPVVLMDEPFSALDAITRHRLQDLAAELLVGRTVVLVTHSPREALRLGHEVRILNGRPVRLESPLVLAGRPPRAATDPGLIALEARLLARLAGERTQREAA